MDQLSEHIQMFLYVTQVSNLLNICLSDRCFEVKL
jgi:hypothetical protein